MILIKSILTKKKRVELASQLKMLVLKIFGKKKFDPKTFWSMMNIALNGLKIRLEEAEMGGTLHTSGGEHTQGGTHIKEGGGHTGL